MPDAREKIEELMRQAEQSARDGLQGQALDYLDAAEKLIDQLTTEDDYWSGSSLGRP